MAHSLPPDPLEQLLSAMQSPAVSAPSVKEQKAVAAIVDAIHQAPRPLAAHRRSRMLKQVLSARGAVAAATLAVLLTGGTAAAATGSLPAPAQSVVSGALDHVGISVPGPNSHANQHARDNAKKNAEKKAERPAHGVPNAHAPKAHSDATDGGAANDATKTGQGPDATGAAKYGLCTAWGATPTPNAHSHKRDSVAFTNLQKAAAAAGKSVADYCKDVTPPSGDDSGTASSTGSDSEPPTAGRDEAKPDKGEPSEGADPNGDSKPDSTDPTAP